MESVMTKKSSIRYILILLSAFSIIHNANANVDGAQKFVQNISVKTISVIKDGANDETKEKQLVKLFEDSVDMDWIAKFVSGNAWNSASATQKKQYTDQHHKFLLSSYIPKFKEYTDQKIEVKKATQEDKNEYLVETEIIKSGAPSVKVNYKIRETAGKYKIYDVIAEGISLLTTQRSEFSSILSRGGIDTLISKLQERNSKTK
jgi:phospholipid transport system substrate-binding protein